MAIKAKKNEKSKDPKEIQSHEDALKIRTSDGYHVEVADLNARAGVYETQGRYTEAEPLYRRALAILEKSLGSDHPDVATFMNYLAVIYDALGRFSEAEPLCIQALAIREKSLGPDHPDVANSLNNLGSHFKLEGKYTEAEPLYKQALEIFEKVLGSDHPNTEVVRNNLKILREKNSTKAKSDKITGYLRSSDNKVDFGMIFLKDCAAKIGTGG